jgi:hypothetical protein
MHCQDCGKILEGHSNDKGRSRKYKKKCTECTKKHLDYIKFVTSDMEYRVVEE